MEVGVLTCVLPDALEFCFEVAAAGTSAEGARLRILRRRAKVHCNDCQRQFELGEPFGGCTCGSVNLDFRTGRELSLVQMEIESEAKPRLYEQRKAK
jgi:hydrogenase nickel incorporation protein HypA/HybF